MEPAQIHRFIANGSSVRLFVARKPRVYMIDSIGISGQSIVISGTLAFIRLALSYLSNYILVGGILLFLYLDHFLAYFI